MDVEIRHLRLVRAVAAAGSLSRAGADLHLTQSAFSHQLRDIESRLGTALFLRVSKRMVLTPPGERLLRSADEVLATIEQTEDTIRHVSGASRGFETRRLGRGAVLIGCLLLAGTARSATGVPPSFDQLVTEATSVFYGEVVDRRSYYAERSSGRSIVTDVTFKVLKTLKGPRLAQKTLQFLGGTVGDAGLGVPGVPQFTTGDRDILFVNETGHPISPIVGLMHGRFRVTRDPRSGRESISVYNGTPLSNVAQLGSEPAQPGTGRPAPALSLGAFERLIERRVRDLAERR